ncbi:MAG: ectoine/hydroxyectoine ABC transporter substrate-binding protein EhuB [Streptosporangiales bacterium]|nr:ectoine/hydroxyectoine ABC transporter substrate-binding protein EhuB [Streptosporangiales bacterium]
MIDGTWSRRDLLKRGAAAGGLLAVPGILVACQRTQPGTGESVQNTLDKIKEDGKVRIGFANEGPYSYKDANGELVGEAPAVHAEVFKALGVPELEPFLTDFGSLIPGLVANRWDVVTAGMFILPDRCQQALFSEPEYRGDSAFLVKEGNPKKITTYEDVAQKKATIGVLSGAVEADYAESAGASTSQLKTFESQQDGLEAVVAGRIDAFALTSPSLKYTAETNADAPVEVTKPFIPTVDGKPLPDYGGAAFRRRDTELRDAFNRELAKLRDSGRLLELIKPYGFTELNVPESDVTTQQLCNR